MPVSVWLLDTRRAAALGPTGLAAAAVASTAGVFWGTPWLAAVLAVLAAAIAGFHKLVSARNVCQNRVRRRVLERVLGKPGATLGELARHARVSRQTIVYHVNVLKEFELVVAVRDGSSVRVFPSQEIEAARDPVALLLRKGWARPLLKTLSSFPEDSLRAVSRRLGVSHSTVHWYVSKLQEAGVALPVETDKVAISLAAQARMVPFGNS